MTGSSKPESLLSKLDTQHEKTILEETHTSLHAFSTSFSGVLNIEVLNKDLVRDDKSGEGSSQLRKLGIMFRDLRVVGMGGGAAVRHSLASLLHPRVLMKQINTLRHPPLRNIISGFEGVVLPGEMLLVLGLPGSGCSTLLKTLANHRSDYHTVLGDVFYDSFTPFEIERRYRGDVLYCPEDDIHFPTLTVRETLEFASTMRTQSHRGDSQSRKAGATHTAELLMRIFGLEHARNTVVGDAAIKGISGGEKKRVSLAEVMSARGKLVCWDSPTRGLDSSTALEFIHALRTIRDSAEVTTIVSIYQAGQQLFEAFDKVCLIYEGRMVYFGPAKEAKHYFMDMGYEPQNRQTTPDFLVASTDPNARMVRRGMEGIVPRTADEMASYFMASSLGRLNRTSTDSYHNLCVNRPELKIAYEASVAREYAPSSQSYMLSIPMQVRAVMRRRWQILKGDRVTQAAQVGTQVFQAILTGTVFLRAGDNTAAYFSLGSVLFFALFCGGIGTMSEIPALFSQRLIVRRHQKAALYYPFIDSLAHTIVDVPITLISIGIMSVILYFLVGLQRTAQQFFTFYLFTLMVTFVMKTCFRAVAAFSASDAGAMAIAGVILMPLILYAGYALPQGDINVVLRWITYVNPMRYAFESLMVNEFHTIDGVCTTLVPSGPGYENATLAHQVCTTVGSQPGKTTVSGEAYAYLLFGYSFSNLWKNLGILGVFAFGFLVILLFFTQYNKRTAWDATMTLYKEGSNCVPIHRVVDEERVVLGDERNELVATNENDLKSEKLGRTDIFSWKDIEYEVSVSGGEMRKLLDGVSGFVAPGKLTALMGESGAGKTTLLNVLAQRVSAGVVRGDCFVNGHVLPADFQAQTAYVQQMDTHIPESTVREALLFSATLRQPSSVPMAEKEAHIDKCLKMCGLEAYADAIVGSLGAEQRKRTTIAVELAAKPKLLLFLDEPTSGLDSQSAWAIVKFLRELADNGQAILCTIHQPSGELFQVFDRLLLLRKGGQTVYFGDIGERSMTMIKYFEQNGAPHCAEDANPAEYVLDVIGAGATAICTTDWNQIWKESPEAMNLERDIKRIHEEGRSRPVVNMETHPEFASSWMKQLAVLTRRGFVCCWRNPMYIYPKLVVSIVSGILIGFTFFGAKNTLRGCQDKLFSVFMATVFTFTMAQQMQSKCIADRTVYEVRERPSKMYTWSAFLVSQIATEVPWNILGSSLLFFCWYWSSGFDSSRAGLSYLFFGVALPLYITTFGLVAAAIAPTAVVGATLLSGLFSFTIVFTGVLQRYSELGWWKWMYWVSPLRYVIGGLLGQALGHQLVTCASTEFVTIEPPSGMTCSAYMNRYISLSGGYLTNPNATAECAYCPYRTTDELMGLNFNITYGQHWRDLAVVFGFAGINVLLTFAGLYFFRIRKGMGGPFAGLLTKYPRSTTKMMT